MAKVNRRKKDLYWHSIAHTCLEHGFKPAQVTKVLKEVFPQTSVTGRHIGAYKRRLSNEGLLEVDQSVSANMSNVRDMMEQAKSMISGEDMFIYNCSVGSHKRSLKCFEYKLTTEAEDEITKIESWIEKIKK